MNSSVPVCRLAFSRALAVLVLAAVFAASRAPGAINPGPAGAPVKMTDLARIWIPAEGATVEAEMAGVLLKYLTNAYGIKLVVTNAPPDRDQAGIILGRAPALASGLVKAQELEAVKFDGYVMKAIGNRIVLAGYAPQGTIFATYRFLRRAGIKFYPWRDFDAVEKITPLPGGVLPAFAESSKPFFDRRALLGWLDCGRWGAELLTYGGLGDFRKVQDHEYFKGKGWLGGDHTAPYLVPMGIYYDQHPEYYAMRPDGKRLPKDTQNMRVTICLSNPDVHKIAAARALEWIEAQKERRFFHVSDGDSDQCRCPACVALDPVPGQSADRYLQWVNSVARAVKGQYLDVSLLALAYGSTVKPPLETRPESNVVVMYCPWYWNSRTTSLVTWANPLNITAMQEWMAWKMLIPDQMGLYDYPDDWHQGLADRIKFLAKQNVRVYYACGGAGDLFQWVGSQLLWNPFLNTIDLVDEFLAAYYGPAAADMQAFIRLQQDRIDQDLYHTSNIFDNPEYIRAADELLLGMLAKANQADEGARLRILTTVYNELWDVLLKVHPQKGSMALRRAPQKFAQDLRQYVELAQAIAGIYDARKANYAAKTFRETFEKRMSDLGLNAAADPKAAKDASAGAKDQPAGAPAAEKADVFDRTIAFASDYTRQHGAEPTATRPEPKLVELSLARPGEAGKWLADGSQSNLVAPAELMAFNPPLGERLTGLKIKAPLSKLPVIKQGKSALHAGRFFLERKYDPALDMTGSHFLSLHLYASAAVPITVYINNLHSDFNLHAGEQVVRIDLRKYAGSFEYAKWDKQIGFLGIDIWPQDNFAPYPPAVDTELMLMGIALGNRDPAPATLPHRGEAVWLSQYRPNIPHSGGVPAEHDTLLQRQNYKHVGGDRGSRWIGERFRTWTEYRVVSPIFAIVAGDTAADMRAALDLQSCLKTIYGVDLPLNPPGYKPGAESANCIFIGKSAALSCRGVEQRELDYCAAKGYVVNAFMGRVAIAGNDALGTAGGVRRYLEDFGLRFDETKYIGRDKRGVKFLHELYVVDSPYFRNYPLPPRSGFKVWLYDSLRYQPRPVDVRALAEAVKNQARAGGRDLPAELVTRAQASGLAHYVANRLAWDPFADATRLIEEYQGLLK